MKVIIDINEEQYEFIKQGMPINKVVQFPALMEAICEYIAHGTTLDNVKAKIQRTITASWYNGENYKKNYRDGLNDAIEILDNIGKAESEEK